MTLCDYVVKPFKKRRPQGKPVQVGQARVNVLEHGVGRRCTAPISARRDDEGRAVVGRRAGVSVKRNIPSAR